MVEEIESGSRLPFQTVGEWAAHLRWRGLFVEETGLGARARELVGAPIDRLENVLFREGESAAGRTIMAALGRLGAVCRAALSVESVLNAYRQHGQPVSSLSDVRELPLDEIERILQSFSANYLTGASVAGAVAGAFGPLGVVGGIPPLLLASLHAIHRLALFHGHDPADEAEEHFAVLVLATSLVSRPSLTAQVVLQLQAVSRSLESSADPIAQAPHSRKITENVAESLVSQVALGLLVRSWPLAGLVLGAGYSRAFVGRACDTARAAYGQRALLRRYGDAARVDAVAG